MIKQQINQLLQKEMDRKGFLKHVGIAAAVVVGVPGVLKALNQLQTTPHSSKVATTSSKAGYGASVYGGVKES